MPGNGTAVNWPADWATATEKLPGMLGTFKVPAPYVPAQLTIPILRSVPLANVYKSFVDTDCDIGEVFVYPDSPALDTYVILSAALENVREMAMNGGEVAMVVTIGGYYEVNHNIFAQPSSPFPAGAGSATRKFPLAT